MTNIGNDYHQPSGFFTCSKPGIYVFFLSTAVYPLHDVHTAIVKNGDDISYNFARGSDNEFSQASTMAVIQLNVGDSVWVRVTHFSLNGRVLSDPENTFSVGDIGRLDNKIYQKMNFNF
ncbi:hypothetical protein KUTeg_009295 [Tegillarca granosa]|uniref:C1q domain-containing protein n=1 Tax=Tegillarca granosa TaxID=220873 RepID=A0ABQ9FBV6_TEGGR|nr:hypothetical protein KUTeg_009295 [Tegillarca granosa]